MDLTQGLLVVGAVVLAALAGHGWWSTRSARPRRAEPVERQEPTLAEAAAVDAATRIDETPPPAFTAAEARAGSVPARRAARLDPLIDAIAPLALEAPVSGELVLMHLPPTRRAGSKPFYVEGLEVDSGDWEMPAPGRRYGELQAGVQMAGRSGALNEIEYSEFVQKVQLLAEGVGAMPDFPDMLDVVGRARELDAIASPLDAQLAVTLRSGHVAWSVAYVQQVAARHGFVAGVLPGRMVRPGAEDGAPPVLVLAYDPQAALADNPLDAAVREVTLSLDVPQTPEAQEPFPAWHEAARLLSAEMQAGLVDDRGAPVTLHAFDAIGRDLGQLYRQLDEHGIAAGSAAARRLFS